MSNRLAICSNCKWWGMKNFPNPQQLKVRDDVADYNEEIKMCTRFTTMDFMSSEEAISSSAIPTHDNWGEPGYLVTKNTFGCNEWENKEPKMKPFHSPDCRCADCEH